MITREGVPKFPRGNTAVKGKGGKSHTARPGKIGDVRGGSGCEK